MGKKKGKQVKGQGAAKTAMKTEKKAERKLKKSLEKVGEKNIQETLKELQEHCKRTKVNLQEEKGVVPSPRCNMTLTAHPDKDELILFGGEYLTGRSTTLYNELFFYNLKIKEWTRVTAPNAPPPRCSHQAVAVKQGGGQLWIFGGEFSSLSQTQFYHYKDLWVFHLKMKSWECITARGGPSARSGHRMVACKRNLFVFGGFQDYVLDYRYFNDVYMFSMDEYTWTQIVPSGIAPAIRSGCQMGVCEADESIIVFGGYSKEKLKKDADLGKIHSDLFVLKPEKSDDETVAWRWHQPKQSGTKPSKRCGSSMINLSATKTFFFGGVADIDEDEEQIKSQFFNEAYTLELDKLIWRPVVLRDQPAEKKRRRRKKEDDTEDMEMMVDDIDQMNLADDNLSTVTAEDDVFTVKMQLPKEDPAVCKQTAAGPAPTPRMCAQMAVKQNVLYLLGGISEEDCEQITHWDMYSLDLRHLDKWNVLFVDDTTKHEWQDSDDESSSDEGAAGGQDDSDSSDEDMDL